MDPNDVDFARSIFTDLVVVWTTKKREPPGLSDTRMLAAKAVELARLFGVTREQSGDLKRIASDAKSVEVDTPPVAGSRMTFGQLAKYWAQRIVKRHAGNSRRDLTTRFERYVIPHLGSRPVDEIEPQEILSVLRSIESAGHSTLAYHTFQDIRFLYRYAIFSGLTNQDPTSTLRRAVSRPRFKGVAMVIDRETIGRLLVAIREYKGQPRSTARYLLRLAPMVFLRPTELRTLEWKDIDLDAATVVVPASRMKSRRPHVVPLANQAVRILRDVHKMTGYGRYVFTAGHGQDQPLHFTIYHAMLGSLGFRRAVTPHGFRVLASTWLNEKGWRAEVIERQLAHVGNDRTRRLYDRSEYLSERRKMMQAWADELESLEYKAKHPVRVRSRYKQSQAEFGGVDAAIRD